jgi:glutamate 5-kinase
MSDIDGVYNKNPKNDENAELIEEVYDTDGLLSEIDSDGTSSFGTGGIVTKIQAARMVNEYGITMLLVNGKRKDILTNAAAGSEKGTIFFSGRR